MIVRFKNLIGRTIAAKDGEIGTVKDVFFDDRKWVLRYAVVDTSKWLPNSKVLLSPATFSTPPLTDDGAINCLLNKEQIKDAPPMEEELPVSRQYEEKLHFFYGWTPWWGSAVIPAGAYKRAATPAGLTWSTTLLDNNAEKSDGHLRSAKQVTGYKIRTADKEEFGAVKDILIDTDDFTITDVTMQSHRWMPGGEEFICSPMQVVNINWYDRVMEVGSEKDALLDAPAFDLEKYDKKSRKALVEKYCRPTEPNLAVASRYYGALAGFR